MSPLPTKYVPITFSILGVCAVLADKLRPNDTVSTLWDRVRDNERVRTFDRFVEGLTLLYAGRIICMSKGVLQFTKPVS